MNKKIDIFPFLVLPLPGTLKASTLSEIQAKVFFFKAFIKSEQLRRLVNDQNEPPVLEEESYASYNSFDGLKRERMIHLLYKWLL